jgi:hypothetical protein
VALWVLRMPSSLKVLLCDLGKITFSCWTPGNNDHVCKMSTLSPIKDSNKLVSSLIVTPGDWLWLPGSVC